MTHYCIIGVWALRSTAGAGGVEGWVVIGVQASAARGAGGGEARIITRGGTWNGAGRVQGVRAGYGSPLR